MKLLFISRAFPPTIGGIENQNEALLRYLSQRISCKSIVNTHGKKGLGLFIPRAILQSLFRIKKIDQILLGDGVAAVIGWFIKLLSNKPVTCILHGLDITWDNPVYQTLWVKFFFKKIDHFIAVSQSTRSIAIEAGIPENKISVIPNGVEQSHIPPLSKHALQEKLDINLEKKFVLLSLGRLIERKGVLWFIENVAPLLSSNMLYLVAGDGPNYEEISQTINRLSLKEKVFLLGQVDAQVKQSLFTHSDLFIQPNIPVKNDIEGFGITQLEAGIHGLPSISSNIEGIKDAIQNGKNGWLVDHSNTHAFLDKITFIKESLKQEKDLINIRVKNHCISNFAWPIIAQKYIKILTKLAPKNLHRSGFSPTVNREIKAKKILKIIDENRRSETKNLSILDIGTGNGEISSFLGQQNHVTSVDIIDTRQTCNNFNFSLCDENLPFKENSFDIIISNHVIEHVQDQQLHINEIKRVLKPNGILYLATPNRLWPFEVHYRLYFLHYLPQQLFLKMLKFFNQYKEGIELLSLKKIHALLDKNNLQSYSGKIIKEPRSYLMNTSAWLEKILNAIPLEVLDKLTPIHPTFVFIFKNKKL